MRSEKRPILVSNDRCLNTRAHVDARSKSKEAVESWTEIKVRFLDLPRQAGVAHPSAARDVTRVRSIHGMFALGNASKPILYS